MAEQLKNSLDNPTSTLAAGIASGDLALTVAAGHGARFPASGTFRVKLTDQADDSLYELVACSSRAGDVLTITRGAESANGGGAARAFVAGDLVDLVLSEAALAAYVAENSAQDADVTAAVAAHEVAGDPHPQYTTGAEVAAFAQPLDSDLTAIAALTTTTFGRALLELANQAALLSAAGAAAASHSHAGEEITSGTVADPRIAATIARDSEVTAAVAAEAAARDSAIAAAIANLIDSSPGALDTLNELAAALGDDPNFAATVTTALAGKQPLDADLTAIAALTTTAYGRSFLEAANAGALRVLAGLIIGTDVPAQATFDDHSARHENGGADELSLAGLDGTPTELTNHLNDATDAHDASAISFAPAGSIAATQVQAAIEELEGDLLAPDDITLRATGSVLEVKPGGIGATQIDLGNQIVMDGTFAARPAAGVDGRLYLATDINGGTLYRDNGAAWVQVAMGKNGIMPPNLVCWTGHPGGVLAGGSGALNTANRAQGHRVIVPKTGTLVDVHVYIAISSGNIEVGILDTTATTRNRLWTTGSIASPGTGWQDMGDPNLAVTEGDQLDFYVNADSTSVTFLRTLTGGIAAATLLPTGFFPAAGGAKPAVMWQGPAATFPLGVTLAEASMGVVSIAPSVIARVS